MDDYIIEMLNITKEFPGIIANDNITLQLKKGEIHALLGENGAGKSTLMSVLFGLYQPEAEEKKKRLPGRWMLTRWASAWYISISNWYIILRFSRISSSAWRPRNTAF